MTKPNIAEIKEKAKQKVTDTKKAVSNQKKVKKNPNPVFVDMDNVEFTGNPEVDSKLELDEVKKGFRDRAKNESNRFALATDTEYWACICFQTREQKDAFLKALQLFELGDKYLDGQEVAEVLGVKLPKSDVPYNTSSKIDKSWLDFVE